MTESHQFVADDVLYVMGRIDKALAGETSDNIVNIVADEFMDFLGWDQFDETKGFYRDYGVKDFIGLHLLTAGMRFWRQIGKNMKIVL